jgi:hypothetical protein
MKNILLFGGGLHTNYCIDIHIHPKLFQNKT